jgi:GAF domain-containing protein
MAELTDSDLATRMAQLARDVASPSSVEHVLENVTSTAKEVIPGVDTAGVLLIKKGGNFESHAGTSDLPHQLDALQERFREGPCYQAAIDEMVVRTNDFRTETRWPRYSPAAVDLGVLSGLSFKLYTSATTAGALNLFGFKANAFDADGEAIGSVLAAHAAAAIMASRRGEQLQSALLSRDLIGQAKGILMQRFRVDAIQAFELLRQLSQTSNTKLVDVAQRVVDDSQRERSAE